MSGHTDLSGIDPVEPEINDLTDARSPLARTLIQVGAALGVGLVVAALVIGLGRVTRSTSVEAATFTADPTQPLRFLVSGLDVRVVPGDSSVVTVEAEVVEGWLDTDYAAVQTGGDIALSASCAPVLVPGCGGEVTIGVPAGTQFELNAGSHDVELDGIDGVATIRTSSGDVEAHALAVVEVGITTTEGDVSLAFADPPLGIKATTGAGDIQVEVPAGDADYDVVATSGSGEVANDLGTRSSDARGFVVVESRSGDIELSTR